MFPGLTSATLLTAKETLLIPSLNYLKKADMKSSKLNLLSTEELYKEKDIALAAVNKATGIRAKTDARKYLQRITVEISKRK